MPEPRSAAAADRRAAPDPRPWAQHDGPDAGDPARSRRRRSWVRAVASLAVAAALVLGYVRAVDYAGEHLPRGTSVEGVAIGGLTPARARERLRAELLPQLDLPVVGTADGRGYTVVPSRAGLTVDLDATVAAAAGGPDADPRRLFRAVFAGGPVPPVRRVDAARLRTVLTGVAARLHRDPRDGSIAFRRDGRPVVRPALAGRDLEVPAAAAAVRAAWVEGQDHVVLPLRRTTSRVGPWDVQRALAGFAEPAVSGPVRLLVDGRAVLLTPAMVAASTTLRPDATGVLRPVVSVPALRAAAAGPLARLTAPARDARLVLRGGRAVVLPARAGRSVSVRTLARALPAVLVREGVQRQLALPVVRHPAPRSTSEVRSLGIERAFATATSRAGRPAGVFRAAAALDGAILRPGSSFGLLARLGAAAPGPAARAPIAAATARALRAAGSAVRTTPGGDVRAVNATRWAVLLQASATSDAGGAVVRVRAWGHRAASAAPSGRTGTPTRRVRR